MYLYIYLYTCTYTCTSSYIYTIYIHISYMYIYIYINASFESDLKGIIFVMLAVHEQVVLISTSYSEKRLLLYVHEQFMNMFSSRSCYCTIYIYIYISYIPYIYIYSGGAFAPQWNACGGVIL